MTPAWQILRDGGLPLSMERSTTRRTARELARAVLEAIRESPVGRDAEALGAFVIAWHGHWPTSFSRELGTETDRVLAWATTALPDLNRRLKLRRIAIENLSSVL